MKYCSICGKKQINDNKNFITIFKDGNTSNNKPGNMMVACVTCMKAYKFDRMDKAVKALFNMGLIYNGHNWVYNNHMIKKDMVDVSALKFQIKFLKQQIKDLKYQLGIRQSS